MGTYSSPGSLGFDPTVPSEGRITDVFLGGKDNFAPDREIAARALEIAPELPVLARESRLAQGRMLQFLADAGIRQVIDLDAGLPIEGHLEDVSRIMPPGTRAVYVERDPVAVVHTRAIVKDPERTAVIHVDVTEPRQVFENSEVRRTVDLDEPVAVLLLNILHTIPDDDVATRIVNGVCDTIAPGSYVAVMHAVSDSCPEVTAKLAALYQEGTIKGPGWRDNLRTKAEVEALVAGLDLVAPGVVYLPAWRPEPDGSVRVTPESVWSVAALGRKPGGAPPT
ncbi:MAG: SAM-dependent methyltransferase [Micromonosporaceae bacterium]